MSSLDTAADEEMKNDAWAAMERGDYESALANFMALLPTDEPATLNALGWMHEMGKGCSKDLDQAASFYQQSANAGCPYGLVGLGDVLSDSGNAEDAQAIYERGALQGHCPSMWRLGRMLIEDDRTPDQKERGLTLLRDAAAEGSHFARRTLLGYEMRNAKSIFEKITIGIQILRLSFSVIPQYARDPLAPDLM